MIYKFLLLEEYECPLSSQNGYLSYESYKDLPKSILKFGSIKIHCSVTGNPYKSSTYGISKIDDFGESRHGFGFEFWENTEEKNALIALTLEVKFQYFPRHQAKTLTSLTKLSTDMSAPKFTLLISLCDYMENSVYTKLYIMLSIDDDSNILIKTGSNTYFFEYFKPVYVRNSSTKSDACRSHLRCCWLVSSAGGGANV